MPRWVWFAPLALLIVVAGLLAYRMGLIAARITETDVIEAFSAHYVTTVGASARITDCTARPGVQDGVWIVVRCVSPEGLNFVYPADRFGRLLSLDPVVEDADAPHT